MGFSGREECSVLNSRGLVAYVGSALPGPAPQNLPPLTPISELRAIPYHLILEPYRAFRGNPLIAQLRAKPK